MTTISKLPEDLVREILSRVPLTSLGALRCTCKTWNALSKTEIFGKKAARNQFLGFTVINDKVRSLRFDLQGIQQDLVDQSTKKVRIFDGIKMEKVYHSDGLLLCVEVVTSNLVVWNPYLGQTRKIPRPTNYSEIADMYAFGYDNNNRNHKILRFFYGKNCIDLYFELYDFNSNTWRELDIKPDFDLNIFQSSVSLKGNTYFLARHNPTEYEDFLVCFDFTTERFCLPPLPFHFDACDMALSCVREEQLAVLNEDEETETMEIWITTKIEHNAISWRKFLKVKMKLFKGFADDFDTWSFFIDEEKKIVVVSHILQDELMKGKHRSHETALIIGQNRYFKSVNIRKAWRDNKIDYPFEFTSYVPSLVQLRINPRE